MGPSEPAVPSSAPMVRPAERPEEEPSGEPEDLTSRGDIKRANRVVEETLAQLCLDLAKINPKKLPVLELPEPVLDALADLSAIKSPPARKRQLRLVRIALRNAEWTKIQDRVRELRDFGVVTRGPEVDELAGKEALWLSRLLGEGFVGLDAFVAEFPRVDRSRLEDLIHRVDRSSHERRVRAERKLADAIRGFLAAARR
jgi:ribosomal 50S subunit-associated protein YjgA (DUF615 family)